VPDTVNDNLARGGPVRLGLVGCGRLAEVGYAAAVRGLAAVEIVALADPDAGRREALATRLGTRGDREVPAFSSAEALLDGAQVDALLIASPAAAHRADAELAAAAAIPCLIEKPPADDLEAAEAIAALEPTPWIGFNRRFQHARRVRDRIPAGTALALDLELRYRRDSWRPHAVDDGALLDLAPHLVDLALLLAGSAKVEVHSATISPARVELELALGRSSATIRCATDRPYLERIVVRGTDGSRLGASHAGGPARALLTRLPAVRHPLVTSLRAQLVAFAAMARGNERSLLATAADGVRVMRVIEAAGAGSKPRVTGGVDESGVETSAPPAGRRS